jgi:PAS domain S-box-containing protein
MSEDRHNPKDSDARFRRPGRVALAFSALYLLAGTVSMLSYFRMTAAVKDLNKVVAIAVSAREIEQATRGIDHVVLGCVMDESGRSRADLDARWQRIDVELEGLQNMIVSRQGQTALLSLRRLTATLREKVAFVLSLAHRDQGNRFSKDFEDIAQLSRYIASESDKIIDADLERFAEVQTTIRSRATQTAFVVIVSVVVVLVLSMVGQAVAFSGRIREMRENHAQQGRLLDALAAKGRDLEGQVEERTRAEAALRQSEAHVTSLLNSIHDAVVATDQQGHLTLVNPVARAWLGHDAGIAVGTAVENILSFRDSAPEPGTAEMVRQVLDSGTPYVSTSPLHLIRPNQPDLPVSASISSIRSPAGQPVGCVIVLRDVSQALAIQERTQHAAKMEAIGQLAGGVAHDFNNLLTGINGNAELLQASLGPGSPEGELAAGIQKTGERAAELVRHLLGFARRGRIQVSMVSLHAIVEEVMTLLRHSVDKRIALVAKPEATKPWVKGDASQIQNALLNLGLNARDAMPEGGALTILTRDEAYAGGEGIVIEVRDTGQGMPPEVLRRIFEPFFTTKEQGKGTGLGLASVYGCVQSHGGDIQVESTVGRGSLFRIRLPVAEKPSAPTESTMGMAHRFSHKGLVMVVDDEEMVRSVQIRCLEKLGFAVIATGDVHQALAWATERAGKIDLVCLDLTMPGMSGAEVFRAIRAVDPKVPILLISGYTANPEVPSLLETGAARFLAKPFRLDDLANEIKVLLSQQSSNTQTA